ncbi:MAG: hypothetical protein ACKOYJ_02260, partial [Planctomycetia bacterium]
MRRFVRSLDDVAAVLIATLIGIAFAVAMPSVQGEPPLVVEEIPPPAAAIEALQADIRRLEEELETLRSENTKAAFARPESATKKDGDAKSSVADRLSTVEKSLGKLVDAADKKKKDDAKKPSFNLNGQVQADQIYFGQDEVSRKAVGDLQDGAQFRR